VGRGRRICVALGYQNIGQVYHHYGSDGGDAVLGSIGTMIFLPGLDHRTAEYASKRIGQATV
jgi:type IV secretory pathway TraG/TraD family ATPase VirD4